MQSLWITKVKWDEVVLREMIIKWNDFSRLLLELEKIEIPRCERKVQKFDVIEIHGFADASEKAYAALIYF